MDTFVKTWHAGWGMRRPLHARFWEKVEVTRDCWWWRGFVAPSGYGLVGLYSNQTKHAHRVAWLLSNGPIPNGLHVLHRCDKPACVNPDHLWLGTHADNMADASRKGRLLGRPRKSA